MIAKLRILRSPSARGRWAALAALGVLVAILAAACGDDDDRIDIIPPPGSPTATATATIPTEPTIEPTELRIAYINLMSPLTLNASDTAPSDTFDTRLAMVIDELKQFKPDVVAFSEVTDTPEHGRVKSVLAKELLMQPFYVRAKPWYAGTTKEQADEIIRSAGFEEGELILINGTRFPNPDGEQRWLNPRTSDGEAAAALWVRLNGPPSVGSIDVFVTHLTGIDSRVRAQQAADFAAFYKERRGEGQAFVLGDMGDPPDSPTHQVFIDLGLYDLFAGSGLATCCRESVVGEQPPPASRTDYIFDTGWSPVQLDVFGAIPKTTESGERVYASDHNGIKAVFPIGADPGP
ncbi:MAG: endonuclease/exonuclease/phosphatase family protein [Tepidiformaceae bacterium]